MRTTTVIRILIYLLLFMLLMIFILQNRSPVHIMFPFGKSGHFGLIYIVLIAFGLGALTTLFSIVAIRRKISKKRKSEESKELIEEE